MESPESHITLGSPSSTHALYCACRFWWKRIHEPELLVGLPAWLSCCATVMGSWPLKSAVPSASSSPDIAISPNSAA